MGRGQQERDRVCRSPPTDSSQGSSGKRSSPRTAILSSGTCTDSFAESNRVIVRSWKVTVSAMHLLYYT